MSNEFYNYHVQQIIDQLDNQIESFQYMTMDDVKSTSNFKFITAFRDELMNEHGFLRREANKYAARFNVKLPDDGTVTDHDIEKAAKRFAYYFSVIDDAAKNFDDPLVTEVFENNMELSFTYE